jgi:hypothetical protein
MVSFTKLLPYVWSKRVTVSGMRCSLADVKPTLIPLCPIIAMGNLIGQFGLED